MAKASLGKNCRILLLAGLPWIYKAWEFRRNDLKENCLPLVHATEDSMGIKPCSHLLPSQGIPTATQISGCSSFSSKMETPRILLVTFKT